jgi:uncharacterized protein YjbI with pentapeptide repeats
VNLNQADLRGATLLHVDLSGAQMYGADLSGATLTDVILDGTQLTRSVLTQAVFTRVSGTGSTLAKSTGDGVVFQDGSIFRECDFSEVQWNRPAFSSAEFREQCRFIRSELRDARFQLTAVVDSNFSGAKLNGTRLIETRWATVNLQESELSGMFAVSSCFVDVSFARAVIETPSSLGNASAAGVDFSDIPPSQLGLRFVHWGAQRDPELGCIGVQLGVDDCCRVRAASADSTEALVREGRLLSDLREYYASSDGYNSQAVREFTYLLAENRRTLAARTADRIPFFYLTASRVLHGHWLKPILILWWLPALIAVFTAAVYVVANWPFRSGGARRRNELGIAESGFLAAWWFFGLAGGILDVQAAAEKLGVKVVVPPKLSVKVVFIVDALVGLFWLVTASAVAVDQILS